MRQNWAEWATLAVSVVAVVGVIGALTLDGIFTDAGPPEPVVELQADAAYQTETGWIVPGTVSNDGGEAAEAIVLRATASVAGSEEESEITLDYLPAGTRVEVSFGFSAEPDGEVTVQTVGFRLP